MSVRYRELVTSWNTATKWADLIDYVRGAADATGPAIPSTGLANNSIPFRIDDMDLLSVDVNSFTFSADKSRLIFLQLFRRDYIAPGRVSVQLDRQGVRGRRDTVAGAGHAVAVAGDRGRERCPDPDLSRRSGMLQSGGRTFYTELLVDLANLRADTAIVTLNGLPNVFPIAALLGPGRDVHAAVPVRRHRDGRRRT